MKPAVPLVVCIVLCAATAFAQIEIGTGASLDLGNGSIDSGCTDVSISGTLRIAQGAMMRVRSLSILASGQLVGDAGSISWSGDWTNGGQFIAGSSTMSAVDGCGATTSIFHTGDTFRSLTLQSSQGREIRFASGQTTSITQAFTANGASQRLQIRATIPGAAAILNLAPDATQNIFAVDVADNRAEPRPIAPGPAATYQSVKGSNSGGWFETASASIPAVSAAVLALLAAALAVIALRSGGLR